MQIHDLNDLIDLSAMAKFKFMSDKSKSSKNMQNSEIHCIDDLIDITKPKLDEPKSLLEWSCRADRSGVVHFLDLTTLKPRKNVKKTMIFGVFGKNDTFYVLTSKSLRRDFSALLIYSEGPLSEYQENEDLLAYCSHLYISP